MENNLITIIGKTTDNKYIIDGVWKCLDTYGIPFDIIFDFCIKKNWIPDWLLLIRQMNNSGMSTDRAWSKISEAIIDTFGQEYHDNIYSKLHQLGIII